MAANGDANRISLADASALGLPELVREAEAGREQIIVRDDKPVAVVIGVERYERLQRREDLADVPEPARAKTRPGSSDAAGSRFRRVDPNAHPLLGRWRIVEMSMFDSDYIDLVEPGFIAFDPRGQGEFAFGAVTASLDLWYAPSSIDFTWRGDDEGDDVFGDGSVEMDDDGGLIGDIRFGDGDETEFRARRWSDADASGDLRPRL